MLPSTPSQSPSPSSSNPTLESFNSKGQYLVADAKEPPASVVIRRFSTSKSTNFIRQPQFHSLSSPASAPVSSSPAKRIPYGGLIRPLPPPSPSKPLIAAKRTVIVPSKQFYKSAVNSKSDVKKEGDAPNMINFRTIQPTKPTYSTPYIPPPIESIPTELLHYYRAANGRLLSSLVKPSPKYVNPNNVPAYTGGLSSSTQLATTSSLENSSALRPATSSSTVSLKIATATPENPVVDIDETWSSCWDDEVQAVYYYNKITGEATWIPP